MTMEMLVALTIGSLFAAGVFLMLRPVGFPVVQGLMLVSHGVNVLLVVMGRVRIGQAPILNKGLPPPGSTADPLAQALVLTAIVISFGMTAFLLVLVYRGYQRARTERVDLEVADG
jgi:multisubunit Na+/H+ antiporter MnhC subunit